MNRLLVSPWWPHGVPTVLPRCVPGAFVVGSWRQRRGSVVSPWCPHGTSAMSPRGVYAVPMMSTWWVRGDSVVRLWCPDFVVLPWCPHGASVVSMVMPWTYRGACVGGPWIRGSSWWFHGASVGRPWCFKCPRGACLVCSRCLMLC